MLVTDYKADAWLVGLYSIGERTLGHGKAGIALLVCSNNARHQIVKHAQASKINRAPASRVPVRLQAWRGELRSSKADDAIACRVRVRLDPVSTLAEVAAGM